MKNCNICRSVINTNNKNQINSLKDFTGNVSKSLTIFVKGLTKFCLEAIIKDICTICMTLVTSLDIAYKKCKEIEEDLTSLYLNNVSVKSIKSQNKEVENLNVIVNKLTVVDVIEPSDVTERVEISQGTRVFNQKVSHDENQISRENEFHQKKVFPCPHCDKVFNLKGTLKRHEYLHTGELPYQCDLCGKRFTHLSSFNFHKLTHTGEKNFQCSICDKMLISSSHLKRHMIGHTGEKKYQCDKCGKKFTQRYNLGAHKKIHK